MLCAVDGYDVGSPPRAWGQFVVQIALQRLHGSPPRAWGQFALRQHQLRNRRFTPTGVGTIRRRYRATSPAPVHPHGRGDNAACGRKILCSNGSPPRAWGQSNANVKIDDVERFTPTGVGTICALARLSCRVAVHPHGRGDNCCFARCVDCVNGSPPRAWGQSSVQCSVDE